MCIKSSLKGEGTGGVIIKSRLSDSIFTAEGSTIFAKFTESKSQKFISLRSLRKVSADFAVNFK